MKHSGAKAESSGVQGHPQLHSELKASLGYVRLPRRRKRRRKKKEKREKGN